MTTFTYIHNAKSIKVEKHTNSDGVCYTQILVVGNNDYHDIIIYNQKLEANTTTNPIH